jgi:hypothetical protein
VIPADTPVEDVARRLAYLQETATALDIEARECKAYLAEALGRGRHVAGAAKVSVDRQRRFSAERAALVLPPDWLARCTRSVVDTALARNVLPPDLFRACQTESNEWTVRIS